MSSGFTWESKKITFTLENGIAFDVYEVTNPLDPYGEMERWEKICREINLAFEDRFPLEGRIRKKVLATIGSEHYAKNHIREVPCSGPNPYFFENHFF